MRDDRSIGAARPPGAPAARADTDPGAGEPEQVVAVRQAVERLGAPAGDVTADEQPFMLATVGERPFTAGDWLFEIKYDGVRVFASRRGDDVELRGRSGQVFTSRYPEVTAALRALPVSRFLIDGEIVALDDEGRASFQRLQARMGLGDPRDVARAATEVAVSGIFFDCLWLEGRDVRRLPLGQRKECLKLILPAAGALRYGDHIARDGEAMFEAASERGLEGIVAKRATSAYAGGRSRDWIKIKCQRRQEFVIVGYTDPQGSRGYFGALHLGRYDGGRLVYVSKVGTGFDHAWLARLWKALQPLARSTPPFDAGAPAGRGHHWVEARLVCEVRFTEWTRDGGIRHPTFLGLRDDKRPEDCRRESSDVANGPRVSDGATGEATDPARGARLTRSPRSPAAPIPVGNASSPVGTSPGPVGTSRGGRAARARGSATRADAVSQAPSGSERIVALSNTGKVFWPQEGYTKGDLVEYYDAVAPLLLPYLRDRPLVLTRYPDGIARKSFFQTDAPAFTPPWVRTERIADRGARYLVVDAAAALRYVANLGTIPLHLWSARVGSLDRPDWLVLDLDPKGAPFTDVVTVARHLHEILDDLRVPSYVKTSGATGLHILVPLGARYSHDDARTFARLVSLLGVEAMPRISTVARPLQSRGGKVYIDFGQNGPGHLLVAPYAVRPLPGAPVSCPLRWSEVTSRLDPRAFTIKTVPDRFRALADPIAAVLGEGTDMAAAIARLRVRVQPSAPNAT